MPGMRLFLKACIIGLLFLLEESWMVSWASSRVVFNKAISSLSSAPCASVVFIEKDKKVINCSEDVLQYFDLSVDVKQFLG